MKAARIHRKTSQATESTAAKAATSPRVHQKTPQSTSKPQYQQRRSAANFEGRIMRTNRECPLGDVAYKCLICMGHTRTCTCASLGTRAGVQCYLYFSFPNHVHVHVGKYGTGTRLCRNVNRYQGLGLATRNWEEEEEATANASRQIAPHDLQRIHWPDDSLDGETRIKGGDMKG